MTEQKKMSGQGIKPYGHHLDDGIVQVCFTLPLEASDKAQAVALSYAEKMGLRDARVAWMEAIGASFCYFVIYGAVDVKVDPNQISLPPKKLLHIAKKPADWDQEFRKRLGRRVSILVCSNGLSEAGVAFEALMSLRGIAGESGLEGYTVFQIHRMRSVKHVDDIVDQATKLQVDAVLVDDADASWSLKDLAKKLKGGKGLPDWCVKVCWQGDAKGVRRDIPGFDFSIGPTLSPSEVAHLLVNELEDRGLQPTSEREARREPRRKRKLFGWFSKDK